MAFLKFPDQTEFLLDLLEAAATIHSGHLNRRGVSTTALRVNLKNREASPSRCNPLTSLRDDKIASQISQF
jgi:hypothetical protein